MVSIQRLRNGRVIQLQSVSGDSRIFYTLLSILWSLLVGSLRGWKGLIRERRDGTTSGKCNWQQSCAPWALFKWPGSIIHFSDGWHFILLAVFVTISITKLILSNNGLCCGVSTLIIIIPSLLILLLLILLREDFLFVSRTLPRSYLDELVFKCSVLWYDICCWVRPDGLDPNKVGPEALFKVVNRGLVAAINFKVGTKTRCGIFIFPQ